MQVRLIKNEDIDKIKWNSCVHYATPGNVLGYKWYIDSVVKGWDALVEGDFETVMPLIGKKTLLQSKKLYQPTILRGLGIYSVHLLSTGRIRKMLEHIPKEYEQVELFLQDKLRMPQDAAFEIKTVEQDQLLLNTNYEVIEEKYSPELREQLNRAKSNQLVLTSNIKPEKIADFYQKYGAQTTEKSSNFHAFQRIMYNAMHRGIGFASGVEKKDGNLVGAAFFIFSHGRLWHLLGNFSPEGKKIGAEALLYDTLIRTNAQKPVLLDFNSMGNAQSFKQFGTQNNQLTKIEKKKKWLGLF